LACQFIQQRLGWLWLHARIQQQQRLGWLWLHARIQQQQRLQLWLHARIQQQQRLRLLARQLFQQRLLACEQLFQRLVLIQVDPRDRLF
jgi:hypothetical protein